MRTNSSSEPRSSGAHERQRDKLEPERPRDLIGVAWLLSSPALWAAFEVLGEPVFNPELGNAISKNRFWIARTGVRLILLIALVGGAMWVDTMAPKVVQPHFVSWFGD